MLVYLIFHILIDSLHFFYVAQVLYCTFLLTLTMLYPILSFIHYFVYQTKISQVTVINIYTF